MGNTDGQTLSVSGGLGNIGAAAALEDQDSNCTWNNAVAMCLETGVETEQGNGFGGALVYGTVY